MVLTASYICNMFLVLIVWMRETCLSYQLACSTPTNLCPIDKGMLINSMSYFYKKKYDVSLIVKLIEENFRFDLSIANKIPV